MAAPTKHQELLLEQEILRDHRAHATGTTYLRGHYSQVKQGEQELLHARDSVGQIASPRNVASIQSQRENREFETHTRERAKQIPESQFAFKDEPIVVAPDSQCSDTGRYARSRLKTRP